jgi:hypothetical protein
VVIDHGHVIAGSTPAELKTQTGGAASPASSSLLVAVLVWPVAIASWKRQVRRA